MIFQKAPRAQYIELGAPLPEVQGKGSRLLLYTLGGLTALTACVGLFDYGYVRPARKAQAEYSENLAKEVMVPGLISESKYSAAEANMREVTDWINSERKDGVLGIQSISDDKLDSLEGKVNEDLKQYKSKIKSIRTN